MSDFIRFDAPFGSFEMAKDLVTVEQYAQFVEETGHRAPDRWEEQVKHPRHPVVYVSWHDAVAYAKWAGARLPTEQEWDYVMTNGGATKYPWGNELPTKQHKTDHLTNVGSLPLNVTPTGVRDGVGVVWQWMSTEAS